MAKFYSNGVRLPVFSVNSKNIRILRSPSDFYRNLLELTKTARSRISLSSLYIGNDMMSKEMVSKAVLNKRENPGLKLNVVLDFYRATRDFKNSSVQTLKPLINMKSVFSHIDICLFLNPKHNILSGYLPERVKEIFGVQHSKIYAFDDNVILSGFFLRFL
ncbi:CDP-diacylglycerol--glycerol-3-phosphate 3-phosphatidyltransferase [Bonamia ostreae]|uniref:CDP-diacylglycerol--glycerol-3-phosphate 3-phosphatidyltransferase n=1 Tax=Bonamia ostreae TaxID=126728 RepID=A0ABV2AMM8_9EUKA